VSLAALAIAASAAVADTAKDARFDVNAGLWSWKQETSVAGIPIRETNTECLDAEKARMTLKALAYDLDDSCTVDNVSPAAGGYNFKLICTGDIPGTAQAVLTHTDRRMSITAKGKARVLGIPTGFSMKADATYLGACPAPAP
jgi:hypothetical protein